MLYQQHEANIWGEMQRQTRDLLLAVAPWTRFLFVMADLLYKEVNRRNGFVLGRPYMVRPLCVCVCVCVCAFVVQNQMKCDAWGAVALLVWLDLLFVMIKQHINVHTSVSYVCS
jgi:hypothetical protein